MAVLRSCHPLSPAMLYPLSRCLHFCPILKTAPGSGGPCGLNSGIAISRSMSKAYLTIYGPGHPICSMAAVHASRPTQGMAKVIPRPNVGIPPTRPGQSAGGNPEGSIGNSPSAHDANAVIRPATGGSPDGWQKLRTVNRSDAGSHETSEAVSTLRRLSPDSPFSRERQVDRLNMSIPVHVM